jgi:hypothetical protein
MKRKIKLFIEWGRLWEEMDSWYQEAEKTNHCKTCGKADRSYPDWDEQMSKIMELVEEQLKMRR